MPQPIKPIHKLEAHDEIFNPQYMDEYNLSPLQAAFLGGTTTRREIEAKVSDHAIDLLETIHKAKDDVLTATAAIHGSDDKVYRVPSTISDTELLNLKTQGLVVGHGRAVTITRKGTVALRDKWLGSENSFKDKKTKSKFDLRSANTQEPRFKRG